MLVGFFLLCLCACSQKNDSYSYPSIPGYDLSNPIMIHLETGLDEISGIVYYEKDTSVFAINDELGVLYKIYIRKKIEVKSWKFATHGDYEDIALVDSTFYVLQSNGDIKAFTFASKDSVTISDCSPPIDGDNDFETLYFDSYYQRLIVVCKDCEFDNKKTITAFSFNPADQTFSDEPFFKLRTDSVAQLLGKEKIKFKPSAAAIHPITKELYIISSIGQTIAIADRKGHVKEAYRIDPRLFKQPEGITFTPRGDLLISNESAEMGAPNILLFKYNPTGHEKG